MHSIKLNINNTSAEIGSEIFMGTNIDIIKATERYTKDLNVFAIIDKKILDLWGEEIIPQNWVIIVIDQDGEQIKSMDWVARIIGQLMAYGADRHSFIIGIGGGSVCDLAGFISSIYMRGTECGLIPTTLLAQVDASIGGKNAININGVKNIIGVFKQPRFVICDYKFMQTIPHREYLCGLAEIIKIAIIADNRLFDDIENFANTLDSDYPANAPKDTSEKIEKWANRAIELKAEIVTNDFRESGERKLLNLGHTFGHAIEANEPQKYHHGEAVAIGICMATRYAMYRNMIDLNSAKRIIDTISKVGLPTLCDINSDCMIESIKNDKKRNSDHISFIIPSQIGKTEIINIKISELNDILPIICKMN